MPKTKPRQLSDKHQLEVIYRDPNDLLPYARNAKIHTDKQIDKLVAGIIEYGFTDPIAIDENGEIVAGHGRLLAAKKLNLTSVPTVQLLGWTEAQKVAYRNFHNKITLETDFDPDLLKLDMEFLSESGFDLELTGFDSEDLAIFNDDFGFDIQEPEKRETIKNTSDGKVDTQPDHIKESSAKEIDVDAFEFDCECPKCGFKFNNK